MQTLKIDYSANKTQKIKSILLGLINIIVGCIALYFCNKHEVGNLLRSIVILYIIFGIIFLIGQILKFQKYIIIDDEGIEEKLSVFAKAERIDWNDITKIDIKILHLLIHIKGKNPDIIHFSGLPYNDVKRIKIRIFSMCLKEKIPCTIKSIKRGRSRKVN